LREWDRHYRVAQTGVIEKPFKPLTVTTRGGVPSLTKTDFPPPPCPVTTLLTFLPIRQFLCCRGDAVSGASAVQIKHPNRANDLTIGFSTPEEPSGTG
jgi:hypothetical protein